MYIGPRSPALVDVWMIVNIFACEKIEKTCAGRIELDIEFRTHSAYADS